MFLAEIPSYEVFETILDLSFSFCIDFIDVGAIWQKNLLMKILNSVKRREGPTYSY